MTPPHGASTSLAIRFDSLTNKGRNVTRQRGVTLTGYAMVLALLVVVSMSAIQALQSETGNAIVATANDIGTPRRTFDELRQNPNPTGAINPLSPPPGPTPDPLVPPVAQATPPGYSFGGVNYQSGYPTPPADLDPGTPYNSDSEAYAFSEGGAAADPAFVMPNQQVPPPYVNICSMYIHYTPTTSNNTIGPFSVSVPGDILGYAMTNTELDNTDGWIDGTAPATANDYRDDRAFESSEFSNINVSGNTFLVSSLTAQNNNADDVRIFFAC